STSRSTTPRSPPSARTASSSSTCPRSSPPDRGRFPCRRSEAELSGGCRTPPPGPLPEAARGRNTRLAPPPPSGGGAGGVGSCSRRETREAMMTAPEILLIDDDRVWLQTLAEFLQDRGFRVWTAEGPRPGQTLLEEHDVLVAVIDFEMPEMNG